VQLEGLPEPYAYDPKALEVHEPWVMHLSGVYWLRTITHMQKMEGQRSGAVLRAVYAQG
jgi:hypothetical protein